MDGSCGALERGAETRVADVGVSVLAGEVTGGGEGAEAMIVDGRMVVEKQGSTITSTLARDGMRR